MLNKRRIYEFDDFRVDTGQFLLTRAGRVQPITPTVFRILLILLERAGEVVPKEDLIKYVWPDSYVEEGNLNRNVSTLRKALDEKPCDHRYIETIPKTGYRFVSAIRQIDYQPPTGVVRKAASSSICVVGREAERDTLSQAYDRAQKGRGGIVCISGDVGLGKSSLVDAFLDDLIRDNQTFHLARSRCSESLTESEPFMPWIEGLSVLAEEPALKELIQKAAPQWYREISHTGARVPARMNRELLDFCKQVSAVHPLIIVIDDFHWADIGSVDLLAFLVSRLESSRVLIVLCYRPVEMKLKRHPFLRLRLDILSRGQGIEICLDPLSRKHVEQFFALAHSNGKAIPGDQALLHAKSEGNPLFLREFIRDQTAVSDSIRNIIKSKLERLDDTHRQLLITASVQGREFDSAVVASTMQIQSQDVEEAFQELDEVHGLIHRIREEELPDGKFTVRYRFVYALYQEACYHSLAPTRKASLSASLAEAFLTFYGN